MSNIVKQKRVLEGLVVSDKMDKTVVVAVERRYRHPLLGKTVKTTKRYKVHDEEKTAHVGDFVKIEETRPLSKTKHMRLVEVVRAAQRGV